MSKSYKVDGIDTNLYNEKTLFLLNIRELRDIGRKFGVPSPTTMKKQELVDYILKIVYGEVTPSIRNACGRPNVREFDINHYLDKIKRKAELTPELLKVKLDKEVSSIFKVAQYQDQNLTNEVLQRIFVEDNGKFYLRERGFVASNTDVEVSEALVTKYRLENFDVVEVIVSGKVLKILTINGEVVNDMASTIEKIEKSGKKQVFHLRTKEEIRKEISKLQEICNNNGVKLVIFSENNYEGENTSVVTVDVTETYAKIYKQFISFMDECEKFMFENENIVVAIEEMDLIEEVVDSFEEDTSDRIKKYLQHKFEDILKLGNVINIYKLEHETIYQ